MNNFPINFQFLIEIIMIFIFEILDVPKNTTTISFVSFLLHI